MKKISNKKKDLELMLDKLNIQVDNPVCIMDQENSKEFIKGSDKDKYKYDTHQDLYLSRYFKFVN